MLNLIYSNFDTYNYYPKTSKNQILFIAITYQKNYFMEKNIKTA
jgi:hypothetical protein